MSDEARVTSGIVIKKGTFEYRSLPVSFTADIDVAKGPTPGAVTVATTGTNVAFSELTTPGLCRLQNLSDTYPVHVGITEPATGLFYPLLFLRPGRSYIIEFSPDLFEEYTNTGTGTSAPTNTLTFKARGGSAVVLIEAFESGDE